MENLVVIKGNKHGILVILDKNVSFEKLKEAIKEKFSSSSKFFGKADMAISFEGRRLSTDEEVAILEIIAEVTELNIICIIDNDEIIDVKYENAVNESLSHRSDKTEGDGQFYKGTLRSGQVIEAETSIIILGDVNPGARVISKGNVIVLGGLRGNVYAGADGNKNAFVVALDMNPMQIKIGDYIARSSDSASSTKNRDIKPKIAYVDEGNIYIEDLDQEVLEDIQINQ